MLNTAHIRMVQCLDLAVRERCPPTDPGSRSASRYMVLLQEAEVTLLAGAIDRMSNDDRAIEARWCPRHLRAPSSGRNRRPVMNTFQGRQNPQWAYENKSSASSRSCRTRPCLQARSGIRDAGTANFLIQSQVACPSMLPGKALEIEPSR